MICLSDTKKKSPPLSEYMMTLSSNNIDLEWIETQIENDF